MAMDLNMNDFFESIKTENEQLTEQVTSQEIEIFRLTQQTSDLEKALSKQKTFHRKFAEEVLATEKIRNQDFNEEKRSLTERNKLLTQENRQLTKDVTFYKKAYEELAKEDEELAKEDEELAKVDEELAKEDDELAKKYEPACSSQSNRRYNTRLSASPPSVHSRMTKSTATSMMNATSSLQSNSSACSHKSSKVLTKISEKLLLENKKLKVQLDNLNATIRGLKAKYQRLENFKKKVDNKKLKFSQDSDELAKLIESTTTKNKTTFNPKVLAKLGELSEYKMNS